MIQNLIEFAFSWHLHFSPILFLLYYRPCLFALLLHLFIQKVCLGHMRNSVKCPTLDFGPGHDLFSSSSRQILHCQLRARLGFSLSLSAPSLSQNK